jgi:threonine aldolase
VVCIENTQMMCGGRILSDAYLEQVRGFCDRRGLPLHLDGARVFNAAVATGRPVAEVVRFADSVSFCLSKGLSAPVGSMLVGRAAFIEQARRLRKMVGGGMRQVGFLAAGGIYALEHMVERLGEDHANARRLAEGLAGVDGLVLDTAPPETNIVFFGSAHPAVPASALVNRLLGRGVRVAELEPGRIRAVTHYGLERQDIDFAVQAIREALSELRREAALR